MYAFEVKYRRRLRETDFPSKMLGKRSAIAAQGTSLLNSTLAWHNSQWSWIYRNKESEKTYESFEIRRQVRRFEP